MKILALVSILIFAGCAALEKQHQDLFCNYGGAYEKGVNDAQSGAPMNTLRVTHLCDPAAKSEATKGYTEGYMTIKKTPTININTNYNSNGPSCNARTGQEAHQSFCAAQNSFTCAAHQMCIYR